jgi:ferredoxin-NADP reductase
MQQLTAAPQPQSQPEPPQAQLEPPQQPQPQPPPARVRAMHMVASFTTPLLPDDYLELFNPLWSTRELRGRVQRVERESETAASLVIKPSWRWPGHLPGQYLRLGVEVDGVFCWRAYSLTSEPDRPDGCIAITPKLVEGGKVSPFLFERIRPGTIVRLGGVEGTFVLPEPLPSRLLFISAGSGVTPIMSMLRSLARRGRLRDAVHVHCDRTAGAVIFREQLAALARAQRGYRLHERLTSAEGRLRPHELDALCPDWREREAFVCGPAEMLSAFTAHWQEHADPARLHSERFQPEGQIGDGERGCGGTIEFCASAVSASSDGSQPILVAGEQAGATLPHGCRMGICHSCVGRLRSGRVRDMRTGNVHGEPGETVRTCINAPEGAIEIEL